MRDAFETATTPIVISGNIGPRGDGYQPTARMSVQQAADYHGEQIRVFAGTDADMVAAFTMNYAEEAIGIASRRSHAELDASTSLDVGDPAELGEQYAPVMPEPPPVMTTVLPASEG